MADKIAMCEESTETTTIDASMFNDIREISRRMQDIDVLIQKAEENKANIKPEIYQKVRSDYNRRLNEVKTVYQPASMKLVQQLKRIRQTEIRLSQAIEKNSDAISEFRFRCQVGEFSQEDLARKEAESVGKVQELESKVNQIRTVFKEAKSYLSETDYVEAMTGGGSSARIISADKIEIAPAGDQKGDAHLSFDTTLEMPEMPAKPEMPDETAVPVPDPVFAAPQPPQPPQPPRPPKPPEAAEVEFDSTISIPLNSFLVLKTGEGEDRVFRLGAETLLIGRNPQSHILLPHKNVSRRHAEVSLEPSGKYRIQDVSSGGGIMVNGKKAAAAVLNPDDTIFVGDFTLIYKEKDD